MCTSVHVCAYVCIDTCVFVGISVLVLACVCMCRHVVDVMKRVTNHTY